MAQPGDFLAHRITLDQRPDGALIMRSGLALGPVVNSTCEWLHRWAIETPDRVFLAERSGDGWRELTYSQALQAVRQLAAGLLKHGIRPGDRIVALSGPSIDHGILMLATQYLGVVLVPLAEQYSLIPEARNRLAYCIGKTSPAMVYAQDSAAFADVLDADVFGNMPRLVSVNGAAGQLILDEILTEPGNDVDAAFAKVGPDTLAKILFTSGSTSDPKGVPQTQRMLCVNQAQYLATLPILGQKHHTMLDWLPWNHVFAGNSNFNMILSNGGTLYLDGGKPVGPLAARTLKNMREYPSSLSFDVPVAHSVQVKAMQKDPDLRRKYFEALDIFFYAGASLPDDIWKAVEEMSVEITGRLPMMMSSWGMTETAPSALIYHEMGAKAGMIGVPVPALDVKLLPLEDNRFELRVRGPNVITEYYNLPDKTAESFDDEGYLITGDAVRFAEPGRPERGLAFDGRIGEDFKLVTGTWVRSSNLRLNALPALAGLVQDIVVVGEGRDQVGLLAFAPAGTTLVNDGQAVTDAAHLDKVQAVLRELVANATGSSNRLARIIIAAEPPHVGDGEITAKGSLNMRIITRRRADLINRLYDNTDPAVARL